MEVSFNFSLFFAALGLACILEALPWIIAPKKIRAYLLSISIQPEQVLRLYGIILLITGLIILCFV